MDPIASKMLGTYTRALAAIIVTTALGKFLASGQDIFSVSLNDWKTYLAAGIGAAVPVLLRWLNINDQAYGLVKVEDDED